MRLTITILFLFFSGLVLSQEIDRVTIQGQITAPTGEDIEGISIYNISDQEGTITDKDGKFELAVAKNDRVQVTALQFQSFTVIVDEGVIEVRKLTIYMNPAINQLEEVIVRPYDLLGNVTADVKRIQTSVISPDWDLSYSTLEFDYQFTPDALTGVRGNAAEEALGYSDLRAGADVIGLVGLLFPKKKKTEKQVATDKEVITTALRQRYSNAYITQTFGIPSEKVNDFIYFTEEEGIDQNLLKDANEIELLEFLRTQSIKYKSQLDNN
ncbi:carboxypeptidase-like regulatory domain-containing protein [Aureitalea marina]|uniref:TonB-dependent receptor n=1 Tax=Aureitalea marina TaxID=930804 RepID=A0A2S7KME7_9FLAO|nr:carboxypeptidase-like regulatory domain-containing protein [Aureitalea marina]PQB03743.1 hypothetical protein BST85_01610 [Aureitalea marina]